MKKLIMVLLAFWIALPLLIARPSPQRAAAQEKLNVVATTTQAADLVKIIAGDLVNLTALMGAGVDPHLYQPTNADVQAMREADLIIYSGLHLEGQFGEVFEAIGEQNVQLFEMGRPVKEEGFVLSAVGSTSAQSKVDDPHFWFDPRNWQITVNAFADLMAELDPDNAEIYRQNAEIYNEELDVLYEWAFEAMSQIPGRQRYLITSHDAFQYFTTAFGWRQRGLQGISTEDEAGVADVQAVAEFVVENEIPVMFVESSVPPDAIEAVQEAVQAQGFEVGIGVRELFSDAMGEPDSFGGTYIGMIATNVITIVQSFGYPIPEWPAELKLSLPEDLLEVAASE